MPLTPDSFYLYCVYLSNYELTLYGDRSVFVKERLLCKEKKDVQNAP